MKRLLVHFVALSLLFNLLSQDSAAQVKVRIDNGDGTYALVGHATPTVAWTPEADLNEKLWWNWDYTTLSDGPVSSWLDTQKAWNGSQAVGANQPTKDATGVVFPEDAFLTFPEVDDPAKTIRIIALMFKAAPATASATSGNIISFNGTTGSADNRVPRIAYNRTLLRYEVQWGASTGVTIPVASDTDSQWHMLISWRINGTYWASLDGETPVASPVNNVLWPDNATNQNGRIGDTATTTIPLTIKRIMAFQGEPTQSDIDKLFGWGMWEMGAQAQLPGGHPYAGAAPLSDPYENPMEGLWNTQADWDNTITPWWATGAAGITQFRGSTVTFDAFLAPLDEVFRDEFDSTLKVCDEDLAPSGSCSWFYPVIDDIGHSSIIPRSPADSPALYHQNANSLTVDMARVGSQWHVAGICSVNREGRGNVWNPGERPTYFEVRFKHNDSSPVGTKIWQAFWIKSVNEFAGPNGGLRTEPRNETDIIENYYSDNNALHQSYHNWPGFRAWSGRPNFHEWDSEYNDMDLTHGWPGNPVSVYDGQYHTYGVYIDRTWFVFTFDGRETMRQPARPDMWQPYWILVNMSNWAPTDLTFTGTVGMEIDYVRVLQGDLYASTGVTPEKLREAPQRVASNVIPFRPKRRTVKEIPRTCPPVPYRCAA